MLLVGGLVGRVIWLMFNPARMDEATSIRSTSGVEPGF
jgi:hypothetical protein